MYWVLALALINLGIGAFDAWLTARRMRDYGVHVELNKGIRYLATQMGPETAAYIGIILPTFLQSLVGMAFNLPSILALLVGFRARFFYTQYQSLQCEKEVRDMSDYLSQYGTKGQYDLRDKSYNQYGCVVNLDKCAESSATLPDAELTAKDSALPSSKESK